MRHLVVFWTLLCHIRYAAVQAQTAIWKFPLQGQDIQANAKDTVLLDWTSTLATTILRMWCVNGTDGVSQDLASSFVVNSAPFKYILNTYAPNEDSFPLLCHAELAADPNGSGVDSPAGITWHSNPADVAKTISQTRTASSVTVTTTSSSTTRSTTTTASTTPTASTKQSTTSSGSSSGPTKGSQPSTSAGSNNTGAIVGGVIGGIALISFIVLALLFLRKYRRDHTSSSPSATESSKRGFNLFNFYKKGGPKAGTTGGVFEKEGDHGAYEKDGTGVSEGAQIPELQGAATWNKPPSRAGNDAILYHPVELPDHSSFS